MLHLGERSLVEAVAGVPEKESPAETARRECEEQIGIKLRHLQEVGYVWMTPSTTTERVHLFLGEYGAEDCINEGGGAAGEIEDLDIREEQLSKLWAAAEGGAICDAKLFMLLQALRIRRPDLFMG